VTLRTERTQNTIDLFCRLVAFVYLVPLPLYQVQHSYHHSSTVQQQYSAVAVQYDRMSSCASPCLVCGCAACTCGDDCQCTETLCQCQASSVINSLAIQGKAASSCCNRSSYSNSSSNSEKKNKQQIQKQSVNSNDFAENGDPEQPAQDPLANAAAPPLPRNNTTKAEFAIEGMTCSMCSQAIQKAVESMTAIKSIQISLATDTAVVEWNDGATNAQDIQETIEAIGYEVADVRPLPSSQASIYSNNDNDNDSNDSQQDATVDDPQERWQQLQERQTRKVRGRQTAFLYSLAGTVPILLLTMVFPLFGWHPAFLERHIYIFGSSNSRVSIQTEAALLWLLATPVQFICGWDFYKMSYHALKTGRAGMDMLVALGTSSAYLYAVAGLLEGDDHAAHFFETAAVLISFVLLGKWMQAAAVRQTSQALTQLMQLQAKTAVKVTARDPSKQTFDPLTDPFDEAQVPIQQVFKGDVLKILRGASIPADGRIIAGEVSVDESMVTGESLPVLKTQGSVVMGGTVCVESAADGAAFVQVTGVGSATALAQIVQLVQEAQTRTVPIQAVADQISAVFVPAVLVMSVITFMVWYALCSSNVVPAHWYEDLGEDSFTFSFLFGIACLVISCPCALGLATPTAVMVGTGVGARFGVLIKGGEALEIASKVNSVIFDKTGTLTVSRAAITDFVRWGADGEEIASKDGEDHGAMDHYILWFMASLERTSEHPLAKAVVEYAEKELGESYLEVNPLVQPTSFQALTGRGASGTIEGEGKVRVAVGNRAFARILDLSIPPQAEICMKRLEEQGKTAILVGMNGKICAVMGIADELKADAAAAIVYLQQEMGVDVWMVTGDNARTANAIGRQLQLPPNRIISEALPAVKAQQVLKLQGEGRIVAMVGDGVNDSPALAQADVGMSLGTGAEIAAEASDMVLVKGDVADVCAALDLSRAIFSRIQWNLVLSLVYNCLGIPIAAGVFYPLVHERLPPMVAALAMALSSISVVMSSLSLRLYQPPTVTNRESRRGSTTIWARSMQQRRRRRPQPAPHTQQQAGQDNDLCVDLLHNDHLAASADYTDCTDVVDNRSLSRMEEAQSLS